MSRRRSVSLALFAAYAAWCGVMFLFHEPWRDEVQSWLLVRDLDFVTLLSQLRYDGHPAGWFLLLWPLAKLGLPFTAERVLHLVIVLSAAWIVCFKTRRLFLKVFILAATPMMYELSALARNYALSALALLIMAACHRERFGRRLIITCVCMFFLINSNIYGTIAGIALAGGDMLFLLRKRERKENATGLAVYFITAAVSFFCVWLVVFSDVFLRVNPVPLYPGAHFSFIQNYGFSLRRVYDAFYRVGSAAVFGALPAHVRQFLKGLPQSVFTLGCTLLTLCAVYGAVLNARKAATRLWIAAVGLAMYAGTVLAVTVTGIFNIRHGVPLVFVLVYLWQTALAEREEDPARFPAPLRAAGLFAAVCVFAGAFALNAYRAGLDIRGPYSAGEAAAAFLRDGGYDTEDTLVLATDHPQVSTVLGFTGHIKTFRFVYGDFSYVPWQVYASAYERSFSLPDFIRAQRGENGDTGRAILFIAKRGDLTGFDGFPVIFDSGEDGLITDEAYMILRVD
ncbi:MAG: hypothetical protein LBH95_03100 [Oscillospiraceae bacterium]|jgi:hypothetical protein|nr:hypothetical protein [Oscillospiraceae bacterium]